MFKKGVVSIKYYLSAIDYSTALNQVFFVVPDDHGTSSLSLLLHFHAPSPFPLFHSKTSAFYPG
jgi:hypothetical protein